MSRQSEHDIQELYSQECEVRGNYISGAAGALQGLKVASALPADVVNAAEGVGAETVTATRSSGSDGTTEVCQALWHEGNEDDGTGEGTDSSPHGWYHRYCSSDYLQRRVLRSASEVVQQITARGMSSLKV